MCYLIHMDKNRTAEAIGQRVEAHRKQAGSSRRSFAISVGMSVTNFRDKELGRLDFSIPQLVTIGSKLGVELEDWFRDLPKQVAA